MSSIFRPQHTVCPLYFYFRLFTLGADLRPPDALIAGWLEGEPRHLHVRAEEPAGVRPHHHGSRPPHGLWPPQSKPPSVWHWQLRPGNWPAHLSATLYVMLPFLSVLVLPYFICLLNIFCWDSNEIVLYWNRNFIDLKEKFTSRLCLLLAMPRFTEI